MLDTDYKNKILGEDFRKFSLYVGSQGKSLLSDYLVSIPVLDSSQNLTVLKVNVLGAEEIHRSYKHLPLL